MTERQRRHGGAALPPATVVAVPTARRVALISDSHGPLAPAIAEALEEFDLVLHAGDVGSAAALGPFGRGPLYAVVGNNDVAEKWPAAEHAALRQLNTVLQVELPGGTLIVLHGHQVRSARARHAVLRRRFGDARAVLYGHSHRQVIDDEHAPVIVNPGACGRARTFGGAAFIALAIDGGRWLFEPRRYA